MTRFIRGFLVVMVFTIFGIGSLLLSFLFLPIGGIFLQGEKKREKFSHIIHKLWHIYTQFFVVLNLIKIEKHGVKQVKGKIIVATHPTFIDILILIGIYDNSLCIAKKELLNNIFLKNIIKNPNACIGFTTAIKRQPIKHPIKAPQMGINAVTAIKTLISNA